MSLDFEKYAATGNEIINMLAEDLKVPRDKASDILRAVLHAMRNRLNIDESLQVVAQLPMALKGVYIDQWDPWHSFRRIHHIDEFINEVRKYDKTPTGHDFGNDESVKLAVKAVFRTLNYYLSAGEFRDVIAVLPRELKEFIQNNLDVERKAPQNF
jgi:uncharacterized protein (DUF2267 family)